jgi:hypothetical protein
MVDDKEHNCPCRCDEDAVQIETGHSNVTKHMEKPAPNYRSHHAEQGIQDGAFSAVVYQVTRNKTGY